MSDLSLTPARRGLTGWHVLAIVVGFFSIVVAVDVTFAVSAYRTFPGEVSATPYEDGIAYNRKLAQLAAQAKLGWVPRAQVGADGQVAIEVRGRDGAPIRGLQATGRLERPATEAGRIMVRFREVSPGIYQAAPGRLGGAWDLTFQLADDRNHRFEGERRLTWP